MEWLLEQLMPVRAFQLGFYPLLTILLDPRLTETHSCDSAFTPPLFALPVFLNKRLFKVLPMRPWLPPLQIM